MKPHETTASNPNPELQAPVKGSIKDALKRVREASGNAWASVPDAAKEIADMRCGPTHCHGCDCHEARRNARIAELEEAVALLREECGAAWQYMIETRLINASTEITHRRYKAAREACKLKGLS